MTANRYILYSSDTSALISPFSYIHTSFILLYGQQQKYMSDHSEGYLKYALKAESLKVAQRIIVKCAIKVQKRLPSIYAP